MDHLYLPLQYWLVNHPKVLHFRWTQAQTLGSTPQFLVLTVLTYLAVTFILSKTPLPSLGPNILKPITALHSLNLFLVSSWPSDAHSPSYPSHLLYPISSVSLPTPLRPVPFFSGHIFYLSKILEFIDTLLIILSKSKQRLTFLHVYHHGTVVVMCYLWLKTSQSLFPVALVTNATVHVIMYLYYLLCAVGIRPKWKRLVTNCQIVQFVFSFLVSVLMLYYHFTGSGCSGIRGWCFNASLLALFLDFHGKCYAAKQKAVVDKDKCS